MQFGKISWYVIKFLENLQKIFLHNKILIKIMNILVYALYPQTKCMFILVCRSSALDPSLTSEYEINDIALNQYGTLLYAASSRSIRIWDLRM